MALKRHLGSADVFGVAAGTMISSGLFVLPGIVYAKAGPSVFIAYLLASVLLIPTLLTKAELVTAMPKAGGVYFFIDRSLGSDFGMLAGIAAWASLSFKSAFALLGIGALGTFLWPQVVSEMHIKLIATGCCALLMAVNMVGVRHVGKLQLLAVAVLIVVLLAYGMGGVSRVDVTRYRNLLPHGWLPLLTGTAMVFVSFGGVTKAATLGEEVTDPRKDLLVGMVAAAVGVSALYGLVIFSTVGVVEGSVLANSLVPLSVGGRALWGDAGAVALSLAGLLAFLTAGNAGMLSASRTAMSMARYGHLPTSLSRVSKRRGTPIYATLFTTGLMVTAILVLPLKVFVKAASAMTIMLFLFSMISLILMRESRLPNYRPTWRCPGYPWTQVVGMGCYFFLLVELGTVPLFLAAVILGGGFLWYRLFATVQKARESALNHLAQRVASADFPEHDLDAELSRITRERDQMVADRFDVLIQQCPILDLEGATSRDEMFGIVSEKLADRTAMNSEEIQRRLEEREKLSTTVIRPGFAVPHFLSDEVDSFQLAVARCREGVTFEDPDQPAHALFVMVGPTEERHFYLQALMAIAEIVNDVNFEKKWERARSAEGLREVLLNAERRRELP